MFDARLPQRLTSRPSERPRVRSRCRSGRAHRLRRPPRAPPGRLEYRPRARSLSACHQMEILPFRRKLLQRARPPARPLAVRWTDTTAAECEFRSAACKWKRCERVTVRARRPYRDRDVPLRRKRNVLKCLFDPLAGVNSVEVQGKRIDELQSLVVLEHLRLIELGACFRIVRQLGLEALLT